MVLARCFPPQVDPEDREAAAVIGTRSFNELQVLLAEADAAASQVARPAAASSAMSSTPHRTPLPPDTPAPAATSSEAPASPALFPGQEQAADMTSVGDLLGAEELVPASSPTKPALSATSQPSDVPNTAGDVPGEAAATAAFKALDAIDLLWADAPAESASAGGVTVGADGTAACEGAAAEGGRTVGGAEAGALAASEEVVPAAATDGAEGSAGLASSSVATNQQQVEQQQQQQQVVEPQLTDQQVQKAQQLLRDGRAVRTFLERNCSQLTRAGLQAMSRHLRPNQLAVFFRNDHFNVVFKHEDQLYLLVTDEGYRGWTNVVWERLDRQVV